MECFMSFGSVDILTLRNRHEGVDTVHVGSASRGQVELLLSSRFAAQSGVVYGWIGGLFHWVAKVAGWLETALDFALSALSALFALIVNLNVFGLDLFSTTSSEAFRNVYKQAGLLVLSVAAESHYIHP